MKQRYIWLILALLMILIIPLGIGFLPADASPAVVTPGTDYYPVTSQQQQDASVVIRSHHVHVTIEDQIARTRIEQVFVNNGSRPAEGTYVFPLPQDVTVSDLVMKIDGEPYSARILEQAEAREVYNEIVRQTRDPALLEYVGTNAIRASVFPIPAGGERTLEIEYNQLLTLDNGLFQYVYPLRTDYISSLPVGDLSIQVEVASADKIGNIYSPTHPVAIDQPDDYGFTAGFETTSTRESSDFYLYYGLADDEVSLNLLTFRAGANEDGFFLTMIAPPVTVDEERVVPRDVVLVLDRSGSMAGKKWEQARQASQFVLNNLNPSDRFNMVVFSTDVQVFAPEWQEESQTDEASNWLDSLIAAGSTNIDGALQTALQMQEPDRQTTIIFLTDGLANVGASAPQQILDNVAEQTTDNTRIFSFGAGYDVNTVLLDELSRRYSGVSTYVLPDENIEQSISSLYRKIGTPILTDLVLDFGEMNVYDIYPPLDELPDLFVGSQLMVAGRYRGSNDDVTLRLDGSFQEEAQTFIYTGNEFRQNAGGDPLLPRLWAGRHIGDLLTQIRLEGESEELVNSIVQLSIRYGIITPYTSFIITEDEIFTGEDVRRQVDMMQPTAQAMATMSSGQNAVQNAQQSGGLYSQTMVPTYAASYPGQGGSGGNGFQPTPAPSMVPPQMAASGVPMTQMALAGTPAPAATGTVPAMITSVPSNNTDDANTTGAERAIQAVGDRTFVLRDGVWIDTLYRADEMEPIEIVFLSDDYFKLMVMDDRVADYLALGDRVIFVLDGQAYEVVLE